MKSYLFLFWLKHSVPRLTMRINHIVLSLQPDSVERIPSHLNSTTPPDVFSAQDVEDVEMRGGDGLIPCKWSLWG